ncbi:MAG TPA: 3-hydroxyacyl-CoA dehydrogenase NAD-binding domain-containing protein [Rhizomicrobium sp.]|nr:3-hydroxyacyl-CoA dehydrogenase NAD-binding domain-containing protein [Rhizomicrobium sp.]
MTAINSVTDLTREGQIAVITLNSPPVNALSEAMREGLIAALKQVEADTAVKATLVICAGRTFIAGADITEFDRVMTGAGFRDLQNAMDAAKKPVVIAIHGTALGGGLETAMCGHYRVAVPSAKLGQPEVALGLVPGAGGTQRLPRLVGVEKALAMVTDGKPISAGEGHKLGLIDALMPEKELKQGALDFTASLLAEGKGIRRTRDLNEKVSGVPAKLFAEFRATHDFRGFEAPGKAIDCVEAATTMPFDRGLDFEEKIFLACKDSLQSKAQRYAFFAERKTGKIPGLSDDVPLLAIRKVGVIGAGLMGGGIATVFANAGLPVTIIEANPEALARGLDAVKSGYEAGVKRGRLGAEEAQARFARMTGSLKMEDLADCDLIVEAVFERMDIKKDVFTRLDKIAKPDAILASNTSFLDIDAIAAATSRPDHVLGLHFFSPAPIMKLLEIVRGAKTSDSVLATAMKLAKTIGKVGVLAGNAHGFIGNRILMARQDGANQLVLEGASPYHIDKLLTDFGMPMGPFAMFDLAGLDLGWVASESHGETLRDLLCEAGRRGQKTKSGYYDYDAARKASPSPVTEKIIEDFRKKKGVTPRAIGDQEILERCLLPMINEGAKILEEGKASRASDIDIVWIYGYGWPAYRGGPMFYGDTLGLGAAAAGLRKYGGTPAPLLEKLAAAGKRLSDYSA